MPIYEYECEKCGEVFEELRSLSDSNPVSCPKCGHAGAKRKLSAFAAPVKGASGAGCASKGGFT